MKPSQGRTLSDWVGATVFGALAVGTAVSVPVVGLLILPTLLHQLIASVSFLTRDAPRATARGWRPRTATYGAAFCLPAGLLTLEAIDPALVQPAETSSLVAFGGVAWLAGVCFALWGMLHLRQAFSLEPAARHLVTSGPYRIARHPLYLGYIVHYAGIVIALQSWPVLALAVVWYLLMRWRVGYEEAVLRAALPEYDDYARRVGRFGPRLEVAGPLPARS